MNAATIVREAESQGLDPVEWCLTLADSYGWDEDMTADAVHAVAAMEGADA